MKVVFASTPDQEEEIKVLVSQFYMTIFPLYFSDKDIKEFERLKVLHTSTRHFEYFGTLKEAYQVITSLQTIISILESSEPQPKYKSLFQKNVRILKDYGLFFPFDFNQFLEAKNIKNDVFSVYTKAANELLV
ncbi:YhcU family protein [Cytobacillus sp. FJAT-54145]|uniref:YhcU family protein n=1 Tax=Cytobacillus spartinae TaxID=3299023 RepID=A0ABW6KIT2_9BACI